ncbi:MAG: hypothetical protein Q4A09_03890 [Capnocytophaga felis]|nr:hypothetical protein [Capnocytophaga felis]
MKRVRKISENQLVIAFMTSLILFVSCNRDITEYSAVDYNSVTGEEIFKSIIFADGFITNQFAELESITQKVKSFSEEDLEKYRETQLKVIEFIRERDSSFFYKFKKDIFSGDAQVVSKILQHSAQELRYFARQELLKEGIDVEERLQSFSNDLDLSDYKNTYSGVGIWVVITVLVAIVIAVNINITSTKNVDALQEDMGRPMAKYTSIEHQQLVVEIVELLKK